MSKNGRVKKEEYLMRLDLVRRYMIKGIKTPKDIHAQFVSMGIDCDLRSVYRYVNTVRHETRVAIIKKEGLNKGLDELIYDLKEIIEEVSRELWKQYHTPTKLYAPCPHADEPGHKLKCDLKAEINLYFGPTKVQALREIRATAKEYVELLQSLGMVYKEPEKTQTIGADGNPVDPQVINVDKMILVKEFVSFFKAKHQNPHGITQEVKQDG